MKIFSNIFSKLIKTQKDEKSKHIFYKIVDSFPEKNEYVLQCINTRATFPVKITDIIIDVYDFPKTFTPFKYLNPKREFK